MADRSKYQSLADALWNRVDKRGPDDCWLWTAAVASHGYGNFRFRGKLWSAHVAAYRLSSGSNAPGYVLHDCDQRRCCNPAHLYLGTQKDNARDRFARNPQGILRRADAPGAKLTEGDVLAILEARANAPRDRGLYLKLAEQYGVHSATIHAIWAGKFWNGPPTERAPPKTPAARRRAKLSEVDVQEIRAQRQNATYGARLHIVLAERFGVHDSTISRIWSRNGTWRKPPCP
jgi:hypothetical protein